MTYRIAKNLFIVSMLSATAAHAEDAASPLSVHGAVRLRYEAVDGQARVGFNSSDELTNIRSQISVEYKKPDFRVFVELWDSRAYGAIIGTPLSTGEVNTVEFVQAYVVKDLPGLLGKGTNVSLTAGRMMLNIGSRRIVAADDYRNTTNGYTGVRADISAPHGVKATAIYVLPTQRLPEDFQSLRDNAVQMDRENFDQVLWGGVVSKAKLLGPATAELAFYHYGERDTPRLATRDRSINSINGRLFFDPTPGKLDYELEGVWQTGDISASTAATAARLAVSATFWHGRVGYTFPGGWKPHVALEFDAASGDKPGGKYGRYDILFGFRRGDFGPSGIFNAIHRTNIVSPAIRVDAAPSKKWDWMVAYRPMWLASAYDSFATTNVRDASGRSGKFAGHLMDARVRTWFIPKRLRFEVNGSLIAKGRFLLDAPNATPQNWTRYGSVNLTAMF